ncbi:NADH-specific methylglyoxal reductase-related protein [Babesia gibsoni]|uniref:NADH-specific methylglyoxal reductase-related protein n=1 Tax=Babesia gibsoni TaxID=33632 RepID=A0AAD8PF19_BABGI|nr:NADH-specific methylglyoxal reductase-related protein [Babesia gibsoni]
MVDVFGQWRPFSRRAAVAVVAAAFQGYLTPGGSYPVYQNLGKRQYTRAGYDGEEFGFSNDARRTFHLYGDSIEIGHPDEAVSDILMRGMPYDSDDEDIRNAGEDTEAPKKDAGAIWEKYKHRFPPVPTEEDFYDRISKMPIVKIKVRGCEIEVRQGGLGLPWFIDEVNRKKFVDCFEPGSLEEASSNIVTSYYRLPLFKESASFLPLPGVPASYLPNIRVVEYRTDVEGYEYIIVLHDSERDYTWTYEMSTRQRAESYDGRGPLELFELSPSGIKPIVVKKDTKYEPYVPVDYFNVPDDVTMFFPRKPLDTGIFRLPKLDDVMNIKLRNMNRDYALQTCKSAAPFGYLQLYQNFWKTIRTREHSSGSIVRYRRLGGSDLVVSDICLGTMNFGFNVSESTAHKLMDYAYDEFGINFVDTAELYPLPTSSETYGEAEKIVGRWLAKRKGDFRSKIVLATKIAGRSPDITWLRDGDCKLSKKNIINAVNESLIRLNTDYIDLLQFHWPDRYVPMQHSGDYEQVLFDAEAMESTSVSMEEQVDAIRELHDQGKIRGWGLSNETPYGVLQFWNLAKKAGIPPPASVQLNYNMLCRNDVEKGFVELCRPQNTGIAILAYGPLAGGILTGKYLEYVDTTTSARLLRFPSYMARYRGSLAAQAVKEYYDIAMWYKYPNLCALAMRWVLTRPFICSTIIGVSDLYQLRENLHCLNPSLGITDLMERQINQLHWKWRDPLRICQ